MLARCSPSPKPEGAAIRAAFDQGGEFSAAVELRRISIYQQEAPLASIREVERGDGTNCGRQRYAGHVDEPENP
jgi:hypothetical protein